MYIFVTEEAIELRESCVNDAPVLRSVARDADLASALRAWNVIRTTGTTFTLNGVTSFHVTRRR